MTRRALLGAALLQAACTRTTTGPTPPCNNTDKSCPAGQACFEDGCGNTLEFAVRVLPNAPGSTAQDFNPVSVATSVVDLALGPAGTVRGSLRIWRSGTPEDYAASKADPSTAVAVQARGQSSSIPGLPFDDAVGTTVKDGGAYALVVPPGVWTLRATPANPSMPIALAGVTVRGGDAVTQELILPGNPGPDLLAIQGKLQRSAAHPWAQDQGPLYRLQVLDPVSLTALSQPTASRGGSDFTLWARKAVGQLLLRALPDPSEAAPLPSRDFLSDAEGQFGALELGDFGDPVQAQGRVQDSAGGPVAAARVELSGRVRGGGTFGATAVTGADGAFAASLLPNDPQQDGYRIVAHTPQGSTLSTGRAQSQVLATGQLPAVVCPAKVSLSGTVTLADATPAVDVPVLIEGNPAAASPGVSVVSGLRTDASGAFSALVEPGAYRVAAMPTLERQLPWASQRVQVDAPAAVALALSLPRQVAGTVVARIDGEATPLPGASVLFYRSDATLENPIPLKLYEAITDDQGQFHVYLPTSPAANQ